MSVLFIGKRFYTNRDALTERFGRLYQLPLHWANAGIPTRLWLIDYHSRQQALQTDGKLSVISTPVFSAAWLKELARHLGREKPDVIVASGDCYVGLLGYWLARRARAHFIFDIYDKYDEFSGYKRLPGLDPLPFLIRKSDSLIFASHALMQELAAERRETFLAPNGVDKSLFFARDMQASRQQLGLSSAGKYIGYFGSMEPERGVDDLIAAVQILRKEGMDIEALLGGAPPKHFDLSQDGVRYLGNLPFEQVPTALSCCDLLALPYRHSPFLDMASSCKIAEYIAIARPVIATRTPNLLENFRAQAEELETVMAEPGNPPGLAVSIKQQLVASIIPSMPENFEWREIAARLADSLKLPRE